nr:hypothetical protein [Tanacetum cinerariifolium]
MSPGILIDTSSHVTKINTNPSQTKSTVFPGDIDLANASNLVPDTLPPKVIPRSSAEKPARCCAPWVIDPNEVFPQTTNVPLNEEENKIWLGFKEFDKTNPGHFVIDIATLEEHRSPIEVDNPIVSLVGNFAAAFNEAIKMYVKKDVDNNLREFKFVECNYLKMNEDNYYFTIILEAIEEGKAGVYETKVKLGWEDGMKTLNTFVLTDRELRDGRKVVYYQQRTHPGSWSDPEENSYSGLERRARKSSCRGYDYYTPWGYFDKALVVMTCESHSFETVRDEHLDPNPDTEPAPYRYHTEMVPTPGIRYGTEFEQGSGVDP